MSRLERLAVILHEMGFVESRKSLSALFYAKSAEVHSKICIRIPKQELCPSAASRSDLQQSGCRKPAGNAREYRAIPLRPRTSPTVAPAVTAVLPLARIVPCHAISFEIGSHAPRTKRSLADNKRRWNMSTLSETFLEVA